jgi:hypothetical protein
MAFNIEIKNRSNIGKFTAMWKLNSTLMSQITEWVKEEIKEMY